MQSRIPWILYRCNGNINTFVSVKRYGRLRATVEKAWVSPIRRLLAARGWKQGDLADKADIRPSTLSEVMNGRSPRMETMEAIAAAFGVPLWALFVDERQNDILTRQQAADTQLASESELTARVEARIMERLLGIVRQETAAELAPKLVETPAPAKRKRA